VSVSRAHRETIFLEDAVALEHRAFPGAQYILRLAAPRCAAAATPGSFVHLTCGPDLPMRRPLSIMRAQSSEGWIEVLYKVVGHGLAELARRQPGDVLSCLGPIGRGFTARAERPRPLLIGGGVGIPPVVFFAESLAASGTGHRPLVLMGDLNSTPDSPGLRSLIDRLGFVDAFHAAHPDDPGFTVYQPVREAARMARRRVDYVLVTAPARVQASRVVLDAAGTAGDGRPLWPSDHYAVVAEVDLF
jgi:hypothetical protein